MDKFVAKDPHLVRREDAALVVVDIQEKLIDFIDGNDAMVAEIERLIRFCDILEIPVVHAEQIKLGPTVPVLAEALGEREPYMKETFGCFGLPEFAGKIKSLGRSTLIICGMETHVCVLQTAMQAIERGYRVQVVADAVGSRSPGNKQVGLARITAAGGEMTCTESAMFELMGRSGTDEFRKVLPLIK